MQREFTYAAAGAQCLVHNGRPLRLQPYPKTGEAIPRGAMPSSDHDAGYIPMVDFTRDTRSGR